MAVGVSRMIEQRSQAARRREELETELSNGDEPILQLESRLDDSLARRLEVEADLSIARRSLEDADNDLRTLDEKRQAAAQKYTEYVPPTYPSLIRRLTVDSKQFVWFGLFSAGEIDRLDPNTGKITEWDIPFENSQPYDEKEALGNNKIWISDGGQGGALVLFDPSKTILRFIRRHS